MAQERQTKKIRQPRALPVRHACAAGIDIGAKFHVVAVAPHLAAEPVRTYQSYTTDLHRLADWLVDLGITTVAMESTSIYWIPLYEILENRGLEVLLVNARHVKHVPGRKTDVTDAQWLQQLHQHGLLRGSFRPTQEFVALRAYLRHRERLLEYAAGHIQHMQKALMHMNVQLHHVVSDITGATGMAIMRAIIAGQDDPAKLATYRDVRCQASLETVQAALTGHYRREHVFALRQALELYDDYQSKVEACDKEIEVTLGHLPQMESAPTPTLPPARHRTRQANEPKFHTRALLFQILGLDLTQVHGFGPHTALKLLGECGTDMSRWPTVKHFTSWLALAPSNKISGGTLLSSRTRRSASRSAKVFRLAAVNVGKTSTALGAFYRRLAARVGKAKAVTATARKLAVLFYNTLRHGLRYQDPGVSYYEERYRQRVLKGLKQRAKEFGYELRPSSVMPGVS